MGNVSDSKIIVKIDDYFTDTRIRGCYHRECWHNDQYFNCQLKTIAINKQGICRNMLVEEKEDTSKLQNSTNVKNERKPS
jgi:hypothetical protein